MKKDKLSKMINPCRYCDADPKIKTICGQCQEFYKEDRYGRPLATNCGRDVVRIRQDLGPLQIGITTGFLAAVSALTTIWAIWNGNAGAAVVLVLDTAVLTYASAKMYKILPERGVRR